MTNANLGAVTATHTDLRDGDSELMAAYLEWKAAYELYASLPLDEDDEPAYAALSAAEEKVMSFTPKTARGAAIITIVFTCFGDFSVYSSSKDNLLDKLEEWAAVDRPASLEHLNRAV